MMQWKALLSLVVAGMFAFGLIGCGGGGGGGPVPPPSLKGTVVKGYVLGASVFADKWIPGQKHGNLELDGDELYTTSDSITGDFDITPGPDSSYGNYTLVSKGGVIRDSGPPPLQAGTLSAPAGAQNITPITDLVASAEEAGITGLQGIVGSGWDDDLVKSGGVSSDLLQLAFTIFTYKEAMAGLTSTEDQKNLALQKLASTIQSTGKTTLADVVAEINTGTVVQDAVTSALNDPSIVEGGVVKNPLAIATGIQTEVVEANSKIPPGENVVEDSTLLQDLQTAVNNAAEKTTDPVNVSTVLIQATRVDANDSTGAIKTSTVTKGVGTKISLTKAQAESLESISVFLLARNDPGTLKEYSSPSLTATIVDKDSQREATATISKVTVTVDPAGAITFQTSGSTQVEIVGTANDRSEVRATLNNNDPAHDIGNIFSVTGNILTIDIRALENKIKTDVGQDSPLFDISRVGEYQISTSAQGVPFGSVYLPIVVQ